MKMKLWENIILILFSVTIISCENVDVIENELPYEEYVVVRAQLDGDNSFSGVSFTKTLPHDEEFTFEKAVLKDVSAYIIEDGIRVIPLVYNPNWGGKYFPLDDLHINAGKTYELFAEWNTRKIYAKTKIPETPIIENVRRNNNYFECTVPGETDFVYGSTWVIAYSLFSIYDEADEFFELQYPVNNASEKISVRTVDLPEDYRSVLYKDRYYIRCTAFDKSYLEYYKSRDGNQAIENIFTQGVSTISWNVQGDKVIGMFVGIAKSDIFKIQ